MKKSEKFNKRLSAIVTTALIIAGTSQTVFADTNVPNSTNVSIENNKLNNEAKWIDIDTLPKIESSQLGKFWENFDKYRIKFPSTTKAESEKFEKYIKAINNTNDVTVNGIKYDNTNLVSEKNAYHAGLLGLDLNPSGFTEEINTILVKANGYNDMEIIIKKDGTLVSEREISLNAAVIDSADDKKAILPKVENVKYDKFYSDFMKCRISFISTPDNEWNSVKAYRDSIGPTSNITVNEVKYTNSYDLNKENTFNFSLMGLELNPSAFKNGLNTVVIQNNGYDDMTIKIKKDGETMSLVNPSNESVNNSEPEVTTITDNIESSIDDSRVWRSITSLPKITNSRYGEIYGRVEYEISLEKNDALNDYIKAADPKNPNTNQPEVTVNGVRYYDDFSFGINGYHLSYLGGLELNDAAFTEDVNTIIIKVDGYNDMRIKIKKDGTLISQEESPSLTATTEKIRIINIKKAIYTLPGKPINLMENVSATATGKENIDLTDQIKIDTGDLDIKNPKEGTYEVTYSVTYNGQTETVKRKVVVSDSTIPTDNLEDGVYTIRFKAYRADIPENESMLSGFFDEKVKVTVKDGKITLTMLNTHYAYSIIDFCIKSDDKYISAKREFVGEKNSIGEYEMQICEIPISDLNSNHMGAVLVGMMGGKVSDIGNYSEYKEVIFVFDKNCSKGWTGFEKLDKKVNLNIKPDVDSQVKPNTESNVKPEIKSNVDSKVKANSESAISTEIKANATPEQTKTTQKEIKNKTLPYTGARFNSNLLSILGTIIAGLGVFFAKNKRL
ncbi:hypothetical protein JCM1393_22500 [Clostridium carnis]